MLIKHSKIFPTDTYNDSYRYDSFELSTFFHECEDAYLQLIKNQKCTTLYYNHTSSFHFYIDSQTIFPMITFKKYNVYTTVGNLDNDINSLVPSHAIFTSPLVIIHYTPKSQENAMEFIKSRIKI